MFDMTDRDGILTRWIRVHTLQRVTPATRLHGKLPDEPSLIKGAVSVERSPVGKGSWLVIKRQVTQSRLEQADAALYIGCRQLPAICLLWPTGDVFLRLVGSCGCDLLCTAVQDHLSSSEGAGERWLYRGRTNGGKRTVLTCTDVPPSHCHVAQS